MPRWGKTSILGASAFLILCGAPAAAARPFALPNDMVDALYRQPKFPTAAADQQRFFSRDVARALGTRKGRKLSARDIRYDGGSSAVTGLRLEDYADGAGTSVIRAHFRRGGKAEMVEYQLCWRGPNDWRIKDVISASSGSLRRALHLLPAERTDAC